MSRNPTKAKSLTDISSMTSIAMMTAVLCILSPISLPIGPVPVSLSILAVYLTACILGAKKGLLSILLFIFIGLTGLPVFSGCEGGPGKLFGPTGGYIIGYIPIVLITGYAITHFSARQWYIHISAMIIGLLVCYTSGTLWFVMLTRSSLRDAVLLCAVPFIAFDLTKMVTAYIVGNTVRRALRAFTSPTN